MIDSKICAKEFTYKTVKKYLYKTVKLLTRLMNIGNTYECEASICFM